VIVEQHLKEGNERYDQGISSRGQRSWKKKHTEHAHAFSAAKYLNLGCLCSSVSTGRGGKTHHELLFFKGLGRALREEGRMGAKAQEGNKSSGLGQAALFTRSPSRQMASQSGLKDDRCTKLGVAKGTWPEEALAKRGIEMRLPKKAR